MVSQISVYILDLTRRFLREITYICTHSPMQSVNWEKLLWLLWRVFRGSCRG